MTDRINAITVILEKDMREDDAESTLEAIRHIKGVLEVKGEKVDHLTAAVEASRIKLELWHKMAEIIKSV